MNATQLHAAVVGHFWRHGFEEIAEEGVKLPLLMGRGEERWGFALCAEQPDAMAYLGAFEAGMQELIDVAPAQQAGLQLGLAVGFASTAGIRDASYRRALKKYSNSVVFDDLGLSLLIVRGPDEVLVLAPADVSPFLRDLDRFIAG
jgi:hypothetical protein